MAPERVVLALDLGTGSCKGALYSAAGALVAHASREYPVHRPGPRFVEQEPSDYFEAARYLCLALARFAKRENLAIAAAGLCTQTPTLVFCDEAGRALAPAIVWEDSRAGDEAAWLLAEAPESKRREWFGMELPIGAASTPSKLLWMKRHRPEVWAATRWVVQPKDYLIFQLTGRMTTDRWCAKGIAHLAGGAVHPEYLGLLEKRHSPSPPAHSPAAVNGTVTIEAARDWGLTPGIPVIVGWSDALAGMLAVGAFHHQRRGFVLSGTSEIIGISRRGGEQSKGLYIVPPGLIELPQALEVHFGPTQAGGAALDWLCRVFEKSADEVLALLERRPARSSERIVFRPYLAGERAPFWNHELAASFEGLRVEDGAADLVRAALRGVALQERLVLECAERGEPASKVFLAGGATRDRRWNQLRADILQRRTFVLSDPEASLRGAAMLAWGAVEPAHLGERAESWFSSEEICPDPGCAPVAQELMSRFRYEK